VNGPTPLRTRDRHRQGPRPDRAALIKDPLKDNGTYDVVALHRFPLGTPYTTLVDQVLARLGEAPLARQTRVAIDSTGVGAPVVDLFKSHPKKPHDIYAITITGGAAVGGTGYKPTVPKRDLINTTAVLLQQGRLRIASELSDTDQLISELRSYRIKTSDSGHDRYEPAGNQDHDDLLLALSLALWLAERKPFRHATILRPKGRIPTQHDRFLPYW
jgi:hypothetical protein